MGNTVFTKVSLAQGYLFMGDTVHLCNEKKRGLELLLANSATRTNSQNNTTLQLAPTPLSSMFGLRSQNNTTLQLAPTPLSSMSALHSQNNTTPCPRQFGLFIVSFLLICKLTIFAYKESTNSNSFFFLFLTVKRRHDVSNLFYYILDHNLQSEYYINLIL